MYPRLLPALAACALLGTAVLSAQTAGLAGKIENGTYASPTGEFKVPVLVLPELGGTVTDTENVVTFHDDYNVHISIACFAQDAGQKWELETRGRRDYLLYFFNDFVLSDFQRRFPGSKIEAARFVPELQDGALIAYATLPGGSLFEDKNSVLANPPTPRVTAKRGTLLFVRNGRIFILTSELAERATQRSTYNQPAEKENTLLADRLTALTGRLIFPPPKPRSPCPMSEAYEELLLGESIHRDPPSADHELLVTRIHGLVDRALPLNSTLRLLPPRSELLLGEHSVLRPDLAIVRTDQPAAAVITAAELYLVAEVLQPGDHHADTVVKKQLWSDARLPRLWMVDPRYLNVEVYGLGEFGFTLTDILANHHPLTDPHLPGMSCRMDELFNGL